MPTDKIRINISVTDEVRAKLAHLARRDRMPQATKAARLLEAALELEEDEIWNKLAGERDTASARFVSHANAWK